ncbi:MAG: hypothetical protein AAFN81_02850 [Bacteroidota bacterium]
MEKSIENIWKEGFINEQALVVPRLNNLYNQKSNHLIDRLMRTGKRNIIGIIIGAGLVLMGFIIAGSWPSGLALFVLLIGLAYYSQLQGKKLAQIDKGQNSYEFLQRLHSTLQSMLDTYARIYRWLYPLIILLFGFGLLYSEFAAKITVKLVEQFPGLSLTFGVPTWVQLGIILFALAFGVFSKRIYLEDVGLVYGPLLRKLDEMLADMAHLSDTQH